MSEDQIYTKEELDKMPRGQLRRLAVKKHGMNNRVCADAGSNEVKQYILEAQGNDEGASPPDKPNPEEGAAGKSKKTTRKKATPRKKAAPKKKAAPQPASDGDMAQLLDAIGKELDVVGKGVHDDMKETKGLLGGIRDDIDVILRNQAIQAGLLIDLWKNYYEPEDLEPRLNELAEEFESAGNADGEDE